MEKKIHPKSLVLQILSQRLTQALEEVQNVRNMTADLHPRDLMEEERERYGMLMMNSYHRAKAVSSVVDAYLTEELRNILMAAVSSIPRAEDASVFIAAQGDMIRAATDDETEWFRKEYALIYPMIRDQQIQFANKLKETK